MIANHCLKLFGIFLCNVIIISIAEDLYTILGVSSSANNNEIKNGYKKMARKWHPDKNKDKDANERFMKINEAYETLSNSESRRKYDMFGKTSSKIGNNNDGSGNFFRSREMPNVFETFFNSRQFGDSFKFTFDHDEDERNVINFRKYTTSILIETFKKPFVIFAYSNFCLKCQRVENIWDHFVTDLEDIGIGVGSFNAQLDHALSSKLGIQTVPTIVMVINKKVRYFNNEFTQINMREFVRSNLPNDLISFLNNDNYFAFLEDLSQSKVRAIFVGSKIRPSLRFLATAFSYRRYFNFGYVNYTSENCKIFLSKYQTQYAKETLLLFNEYFQSSFASLSMTSLKRTSINELLEKNKLLILPRLSSKIVFNDVCLSDSPKTSKQICIILLMNNMEKHYQHRIAFQQHIYATKNSYNNRVKYGYIYANTQEEFIRSILQNENSIENATNGALRIAIIWRNSYNHIQYDWVSGGWNLQELSNSKQELKNSIQFVLKSSNYLSFTIKIPTFMDELQPPLLRRMLNKLIDWYDILLIAIFSIDGFTYFSIFASIIVVVGIGFVMSVANKIDEENIRKHKAKSEVLKQTVIENKPTVTIERFGKETYQSYIINGQKGLRCLIVLVDGNNKVEEQDILKKFANVVLPYSRLTSFTFCILDLNIHLDWYRSLLEQTLDFQRNLKGIQARNCIGTVIALNGFRKYYSIFHPKLQSSYEFLGLNDDSETEHFNINSDNSKVKNIFYGLDIWLERLVDGDIKRFKMKYWPRVDS